MPELPEIETIMRGLNPHLENTAIEEVVIRRSNLRWPIPSHLNSCLKQQKITQLSRRGKYLLIHVSTGTLIIHLGMSGRLCILSPYTEPKPHDHVDFILSEGKTLRYTDARRFGAILWTNDNPLAHPLLKPIGIEPLNPQFTGHYLHQKTLKRQTPIKALIMNAKIVAGIGNIYAAEALFLAHIHPTTSAGALTLKQCEQLVETIKLTLNKAIHAGGTTLKDFMNSDGSPGYFSQQLCVYGRGGLPCKVCGTALQSIQLGQRNTVYCKLCQPKSSTN